MISPAYLRNYNKRLGDDVYHLHFLELYNNIFNMEGNVGDFLRLKFRYLNDMKLSKEERKHITSVLKQENDKQYNDRKKKKNEKISKTYKNIAEKEQAEVFANILKKKGG